VGNEKGRSVNLFDACALCIAAKQKLCCKTNACLQGHLFAAGFLLEKQEYEVNSTKERLQQE